MPRPLPLSAKASGTNGPGATGGTCRIDFISKLMPSRANCTVFFSGPSRLTMAAMPSSYGHRQVSCPEFKSGFSAGFSNGPSGSSAIATPCMRVM